MVVPRPAVRWATGLATSSARGTRAAGRTRSWQHMQRRGYPASEGHGSHKSSSDLPWAIGSAVVTIPSVAYLIQPMLNKEHDHGHGHGGHGEDHQEESAPEGEEKLEGAGGPEAGEQQESEQGSDAETQEGEAGDSTSDGNNTSLESDSQPRPDHSVQDAGQGTPDTASDEDPKAGAHEVDSGSNVEGVQFKGATSGGTREGEQGDTRKHIPDAKGFNKKRIESDYGKPLGTQEDEDRNPASGPKASKQEGLSNTDTKHSTDMDNNPDKSKKGEGSVETGKLKGAVDPSRPQA
ncbi:MAG: hypothetical protein Q9222_005116 [Ikaeria aurantiellina]